jgi:UDP-N-acetylmuramoylalanine--D-glutamate ligase
MSILEEVAEKKVIILGLGREGISTYRYLRSKYPKNKLTVADKNSVDELDQFFVQQIMSDRNVELITGPHYLDRVCDFDLIFKTPGMSHTLPEIIKAIKKGSVVYSNTALFFNEFNGIIIGITGTKGKSTTTRLIFDVISNGGLKTKLMGNIGIPPLSTLEELSQDTIVVMELSSHQLYDLRQSPHISVLQGIFPEHLDYYDSFDEYVNAKANIARFQKESDYLIYNKDNTIASSISNESKAKKFSFGLGGEDLNCYLEADWLIFKGDKSSEKLIQSSEIKLIGKFNILNVMPAVIIGKLFSIPSKKIRQAIINFVPLEHRLELVATSKNNVVFINDSLATTPESTINAIDSYPGREIILITGGYDRQLNFQSLAHKIIDSKVRVLILFPSTGARIKQEIDFIFKNNELQYYDVTSMAEAVNIAMDKAKPGDIILLSPASASFNSFIDYRDRGNQFKSLAMKELRRRNEI